MTKNTRISNNLNNYFIISPKRKLLTNKIFLNSFGHVDKP